MELKRHASPCCVKIWFFGFMQVFIPTFYYAVASDITHINTTGFLFHNLYFLKICFHYPNCESINIVSVGGIQKIRCLPFQ